MALQELATTPQHIYSNPELAYEVGHAMVEHIDKAVHFESLLIQAQAEAKPALVSRFKAAAEDNRYQAEINGLAAEKTLELEDEFLPRLERLTGTSLAVYEGASAVQRLAYLKQAEATEALLTAPSMDRRSMAGMSRDQIRAALQQRAAHFAMARNPWGETYQQLRQTVDEQRATALASVNH